jgi:hypothetical protein
MRFASIPGLKGVHFVIRRNPGYALLFAVCLSSSWSCLAGEPTAPTADEVIHKAVARAQLAQSRPGQKDFTYTKVSVTEELDSHGKVKERKEKVYQVYFQKGATYAKLVEMNGRALGQADARAQAESDAASKQVLGDAKQIKSEKSFLTPEVAARFDFKLVGQQVINDRQAYQISFAPKNPEPAVHGILDRLMNRISGTVWIDAQEFEIARADLQLGSEVTLLGGVAGSLKKLAYTMTRTRVGDGIWLNTSSSGDFEGRKLIDAMRIKTRSHTIGFRPLG